MSYNENHPPPPNPHPSSYSVSSRSTKPQIPKLSLIEQCFSYPWSSSRQQLSVMSAALPAMMVEAQTDSLNVWSNPLCG
ncbi:hypothetical protein RRG08_031526 [Elysia crispata]|uniref:Uncharacterized protein n=1 Tax=Elysia crispata TaxID=231223 RepID=A0AAE0Z3N9_9GAST|nr:hypothetical protein RRG08_031526 [Elysia crispata]